MARSHIGRFDAANERSVVPDIMGNDFDEPRRPLSVSLAHQQRGPSPCDRGRVKTQNYLVFGCRFTPPEVSRSRYSAI
jgi:hypothetical protein